MKNFGLIARRCLKVITAQKCVKESVLSSSYEKWIGNTGLDDPDVDYKQRQLLLQQFLYPRKQFIDMGVPNPFKMSPFQQNNQIYDYEVLVLWFYNKRYLFILLYFTKFKSQ